MDLTLENIGYGAIAENFEDELKKVVANILDVNTNANTVREVNLKLKIKPNIEDREVCEMEVILTNKLAPVRALSSSLRVGMNTATGEINAIETMPTQGELFPQQTKVSRIK